MQVSFKEIIKYSILFLFVIIVIIEIILRICFYEQLKTQKYPFDLIGGFLLAGDSTKLRAHNSKKNNYNIEKQESRKEQYKELEKQLDESGES